MMKINKSHNGLRFFLILSFIITGCEFESKLHFNSFDSNESITIITKGNLQYLIAGKHYKVPDSNHVKLDISSIDLAGGFYLCWNPNDRCKWDAVIHKANVLESKLDTSMYKFSTSLPLDSRGIPNVLKFEGGNCIQYDLTSKKFLR